MKKYKKKGKGHVECKLLMNKAGALCLGRRRSLRRAGGQKGNAPKARYILIAPQ